jgi:predicted transcriptional regulator
VFHKCSIKSEKVIKANEVKQRAGGINTRLKSLPSLVITSWMPNGGYANTYKIPTTANPIITVENKRIVLTRSVHTLFNLNPARKSSALIANRKP